jgi:succinate dehydrogenase flavin-adding protein (antitoxin of CptAB toxin-antitoxin module)
MNTELLKKLSYRSNYRGCKETDLLLGKFAEQYLPQLSALQLQEYEDLLNQADVDIYQALMDKNNTDFQNLSIWPLLMRSMHE